MTLPDTQERKCVCELNGFGCCNDAFSPQPYMQDACGNPDPKRPTLLCGHERACHHPLPNQEQPND